MLLCFELVTPEADQSWTKVHHLVRSTQATMRGEAILKQTPYIYKQEGGTIQINVSQVAGQEARKIRNKSAGFCGYDWMISSILEHGEIVL